MRDTDGPTWRLIVLVPSTFFATALLVGGAVSALLEPWIEFSLFLGIPAGLLAGVVAAGGVAAGFVVENSPVRTQIAMGVAGFSLAFLLSFGGVLLVLDAGVVISLGLSVVLGLVGGVFAYVRSRPGTIGHSGSTAS